jgi:predicted Ser/Thr protein kinase
MIEELKQLLHQNWISLGVKDAPQKIRSTKFCQRLAGADTKVLFYVTNNGKPVCILKQMRNAQFNERLKKEAEAQKKLTTKGLNFIPKIYFEGVAERKYTYAEEIIEGRTLSMRAGLKHEAHIIEMVSSFPVGGSISSSQLTGLLNKYIPKKEGNIMPLMESLQKEEVVLTTGLTHGDLGLPNIIQRHSSFYIIDWGRAGEKPFYLIDAVYLLIRLHRIRNLEDWNERGVPLFMRYTKSDFKTASALYCIHIIFEILNKKYPELYTAVTNIMSNYAASY